MAKAVKQTIRPNPNAVRLIKRIADEDVQTFGELALAESREVTPVKTGALKRRHVVKKTARNQVTLKSRTNYGAYVHFGTTRMEARPFFAWGTDAAIPKMIKIINDRDDYRE